MWERQVLINYSRTARHQKLAQSFVSIIYSFLRLSCQWKSAGTQLVNTMSEWLLRSAKYRKTVNRVQIKSRSQSNSWFKRTAHLSMTCDPAATTFPLHLGFLRSVRSSPVQKESRKASAGFCRQQLVALYCHARHDKWKLRLSLSRIGSPSVGRWETRFSQSKDELRIAQDGGENHWHQSADYLFRVC